MFQLCCRICLQQKNFTEVRSLFDTYNGFVLRDALLELFQIKVHQTDMLSTICKACLSQLCTARDIRKQFLEQNQKYRQITSPQGQVSAEINLENSPQPSTTNDDSSLPAVDSTIKVESTTKGDLEPVCATEATITDTGNLSEGEVKEVCSDEEVVYVLERVEPLDAQDTRGSNYELKLISDSPQEESSPNRIEENLEIFEYMFDDSNDCAANENGSKDGQIETAEGLEAASSDCSVIAIRHVTSLKEEVTEDNNSSDLIFQYECNQCSTMFSSQNLLSEHTVSCTSLRSKTTKTVSQASVKELCPPTEPCGKRERRKRNVQEKAYWCAACGVIVPKSRRFTHSCDFESCPEQPSSAEEIPRRGFGCRGNEAKHGADTAVKKRSTKQRLHCRFCPKSFAGSSALEGHENTHTRRQSFRCSVCSKDFAQYTSMRRHMKIHLEIKSHQCDICDARFRQRTVMLAHRRRHTGEKPYQCKLCPKRFRDHSTFSKHRRVHEPKLFVLNENNDKDVGVQMKEECIT